jgi:hypothetical protein
MPRAAMARRPALRETAVLTPEAIPAWRCSTAPSTAVVSGATLIDIPSPKSTMAGKKSVQ